MIERSEATRPYLDAFVARRRDLAAGGRAWTAPLREAAMARFAERGFPTTRDEAWRYTSVAPIAAGRFDPDTPARPGAVTPDLFQQLTFEPWECTHVVFLNGRFARELSKIGTLPAGVRFKSLEDALDRDRELVEPHLGRCAAFADQPFADLNTAFLRDGIFLYVPKGMAIEEEIHLLYVTTSNGTAALAYPRNLIVVEEGARLTLVESYAGIGGDVYLTNAVTEVSVGAGASVDHYRLQRESTAAYHVGVLGARVGRDARFASNSIALGGRLVRQDVSALLDGEGADCTLNGLYVTSGEQHVDNHTVIDHARPHGTSRELYKGILDGRSRGVFDGTIIVRPDAQKSDARQTNKNLLLSEEALADSKPTLIIEADDVKCNHGATIGQLDENALFYLRSRGLGREMARNLITHAFAGDIVSRIGVPAVRAGLDCLLFTRLPGRHGSREAP
jgi:Fe-S cluster assembly protein SufD